MTTEKDTALHKRAFEVTEKTFSSLALEVFRFQYGNGQVYRQFCDMIKCDPKQVTGVQLIPFLPISLFKSRDITTTDFEPEMIFQSSGTTGTVNSRHLIKDISIYEQSFLSTFTRFYGDPSGWCILGLLPSYLERKDSSLVYMTKKLIELARPGSGFYLHDHSALHDHLVSNEIQQQKTLLIGVTYALLDFAQSHPLKLNHTIVMETGGMKGRRKELTREEVHEALQQRFGINEVHSEYGMTELLSQAYAEKKGVFRTPEWMKILVRSEDDPFEIKRSGEVAITGAANIIDLANVYSCSFIATDDLVRLNKNETFEVLGRMDNSDIRGCGLMIT
jgi:hypothetical protein